MKVICIVDKGWPLPGPDTTFSHPEPGAVHFANGDVGEVDENDEKIKEAIAKGYLEEVVEKPVAAAEEEE